MECISNKLKMSFSEIEVLCETAGWKMLADVEGHLTIIKEGKVFFDEENILLLELATALMKWLKTIESGSIINFYYESMDYEDKPILAFILDKNGNWRLLSIWEIFADNSDLLLEDIIYVIKKYITELAEYLISNFGIDFLHLLESRTEYYVELKNKTLPNLGFKTDRN